MKKDVLIFEKDKTGELDNVSEAVRKKYFPKLKYASINHIFRTVFKKDDEGMIVIGEARKLTNRERDLYIKRHGKKHLIKCVEESCGMN